MNTTSIPSYHKMNPAHDFLGIRSHDLEHDVECFLDLREQLVESEEDEATRASSIAYVDAFLDRVVSELEHRDKRNKSRRSSKAGVRWSREDRYQDLKALAQDIKAQLPVADYLEHHVPWALMKPAGDRLRGRCPFPDHPENTASFVVFPDDHAWCFGCQRGGDLFRLIGLIEGIDRFRDQLEYAVELVEPAGRRVS